MRREKLGNWLYGVAFQTAMKARATTAKRRVRDERQAWEVTEPVRDSRLHNHRFSFELPASDDSAAHPIACSLEPPLAWRRRPRGQCLLTLAAHRRLRRPVASDGVWPVTTCAARLP